MEANTEKWSTEFHVPSFPHVSLPCALSGPGREGGQEFERRQPSFSRMGKSAIFHLLEFRTFSTTVLSTLFTCRTWGTNQGRGSPVALQLCRSIASWFPCPLQQFLPFQSWQWVTYWIFVRGPQKWNKDCKKKAVNTSPDLRRDFTVVL